MQVETKSEDRIKLDDRMKVYERHPRTKLLQEWPAIIRVDGRTFSTYTKYFNKPYDVNISGAMQHAAVILCDEVQNAKIGFGQSDEITVIMCCDGPDVQQWFAGRAQKIVSNAASIVTEAFNEYMDYNYWPNVNRHRRRARFDARVFNIPPDEVCNSLIWRQRDAIKNSKQQLGRHHFSQQHIHKKNTNEVVEMLSEIGVNWSDLSVNLQRGFCAVKEHYVSNGGNRSRWVLDMSPPLFGQDRDYVDNKVYGKIQTE